MKRFNELNFLNTLYKVDLGEDKILESKIKSIERFIIFWNLFEKLGFGGEFKVNRLNLVIDGIYSSLMTGKNINAISEILSYYKLRYINNYEYSLENLSINTDADEGYRLELNNYLASFVGFFEKSDEYKKQGLKLLCFLIYRYRNNLFHGTKNPYYLGHQNQNFNVANKFLSLCIKSFVYKR